MLQRHCARYVYVIPDGLRELMSDISREVLRGQPRDVYAFIADYLDALMITRENARVAARSISRLHSILILNWQIILFRLVQSLTELATTTATFLEETGMPRDDIEHIVHAIQKTFQKSIDPDQPPQGPLSVDDEEETIITDIMTEIDVAPHQAEIAAGIIQQAYRRYKIIQRIQYIDFFYFRLIQILIRKYLRFLNSSIKFTLVATFCLKIL